MGAMGDWIQGDWYLSYCAKAEGSLLPHSENSRGGEVEADTWSVEREMGLWTQMMVTNSPEKRAPFPRPKYIF